MKKKYQVRLNGENYTIKFDGEIGLYGFYTTRFVSARNEDEAANIAISLICEEIRAEALNDENDPPRNTVEWVREIASFEGLTTPGCGFTFYPEEEM